MHFSVKLRIFSYHQLVFRRVPEAFYRVHTLEGSLDTHPYGTSGEALWRKIVLEHFHLALVLTFVLAAQKLNETVLLSTHCICDC